MHPQPFCTWNFIEIKWKAKRWQGLKWSPHTVRTLSMIYCHLSLTIEVTRKEIWAPDCISMCELILKDSDMNLDINTEVFQHNSNTATICRELNIVRVQEISSNYLIIVMYFITCFWTVPCTVWSKLILYNASLILIISLALLTSISFEWIIIVIDSSILRHLSKVSAW